MIVISVKANKRKVIMVATAVVLLLAAVCAWSFGRNAAAPTAGTEYGLAAGTDAQRKAFLAQFGWEIAEDPVEICEVMIPEMFNEVYEAYNILQKEQGFDLSRYKGKRVKRWTYEITNYPDVGENTRVYADLLIHDGKVIGGNVGTREAEGFLQGFRRDSAPMTRPENDSSVPDEASSGITSGT